MDLQSAKGARCISLGQRPKLSAPKMISAEGAKLFNDAAYYAPSALSSICITLPRALPWAITSRAFGAPSATSLPLGNIFTRRINLFQRGYLAVLLYKLHDYVRKLLYAELEALVGN